MGCKQDAIFKRKVPPTTLSPRRAFSGDMCSVLPDMHSSVVRFRLDIKKAPMRSIWSRNPQRARKLCGEPPAPCSGGVKKIKN